MKRIILFILMCITAFCTCAFLGCEGGCNNGQTPGPDGEPPLQGEHTLSGFENMDDMYAIRWINVTDWYDAYMDINTDTQFVKEGTGSFEIDFFKANFPIFLLRTENTYKPNLDVTDLKTVSTWIYNDNATAYNVAVTLMGSGSSNILTQTFELEPNAWTECVLQINPVMTEYLQDKIIGFAIEFKHEISTSRDDAVTFYVDKLGATFGNEFTSEHQQIVNTIESLSDEIYQLTQDSSIDLSDEAKISAVYDKYNGLDDIYKPAILNYNDLTKVMNTLRAARDTSEAVLPGASAERPIFHTDKFYGVTELAIAESSKVSFGYSKTVHRDGEVGSTMIKFTGEVWNYIDIITNVSIYDYEFVDLYLYNDGLEKACWIASGTYGENWQKRYQLKTGVWTHISLPAEQWNEKGGRFIITTSVNGGDASRTDGNVYISQGRAFRMQDLSVYNDVLNANTPFTSADAQFGLSDDNTNVTITKTPEANETTAKASITVNKTAEINSAQSVFVSINAPRVTTVKFLSDTGSQLLSAPVVTGWNTITLTSAQFNGLVTIELVGAQNEVYTFGAFYSSRTTDLDAMRLIFERQYLDTTLANWTTNDLLNAISYVKTYANYVNNLTELHAQFVKVSESANKNIYDEQVALYDEIVEQITLKKARIESLVLELVDSINTETATTNQKYQLQSVYNAYIDCGVFFAQIDGTRTEKIGGLINALPMKLFDASNEQDYSMFAMDDTNGAYPWTGTLVPAVHQTQGNVMAMTVISYQSGNENPALKYDPNINLSNYGYLSFKVYAPTTTTLRFTTWGWGATVTNTTLNGGEWTEIFVTVEEYKSAGYILFTEFSVSAGNPKTIYFTDFYAYNDKQVTAAISLISEPTAITISEKAEIDSIKASYNRLPSIMQASVVGYDKLERCSAKIVDLLIDEIPASPELSDNEKIVRARKAYNELTTNEKALVENYSKLVSSEATLVTAQIDALPDDVASLTVLDATKINTAKKAYDTLDQDGKTLVGAVAYEKLSGLIAAAERSFVILNDMTSTDGYSKKTDWGENTFTINFSVGTDSVYGNYLNVELVSATGEGHVLINYPKATVPENAQKIYTYIYYESADGSSTGLYGNALSGVTLVSGEWTKVDITEWYKTYSYIGKDYLPKAAAPGVIKISAIYATTLEYEVKVVESLISALDTVNIDQDKVDEARLAYDALSETAKGLVTNYNTLLTCEAKTVVALIDALPEADAVEGYHYSLINKIKTIYDALSADAKSLVNNYSEFTPVETAYNTNFVVMDDMSSTANITVNDSGYGNASCTTLGIGIDETYGNYLSAKLGTKTHEHLVLTINNSTDLTGCVTIGMYVYNGGSKNRSFLTNIGGEIIPEYATLTAGEWTLVTFDVSDFTSGNYIGILEAESNTEYKISFIYATTLEYELGKAEDRAVAVKNLISALDTENIDAQKVAEARTAYETLTVDAKALVDNYNVLVTCEAKLVTAQINALPDDATKITAFDAGKINSAKTTYDALDQDGKDLVGDTAYTKLSGLISAYEQYFYIVNDMTSLTGFVANDLNDVAFSYKSDPTLGVDDNYGNYVSVKITGNENADRYMRMYFAKPSDLETALANYDNVRFAIYNGYSLDRDFFYGSGTSYTTEVGKLKAGEWTEITFTKAQLLACDWVGVWSVGWGAGEYKLSMIYATTSAYETLQEQNQANAVKTLISALNTETVDTDKVAEARLAYDALSETAKALVDNYDTLLTCEAKAVVVLINSLPEAEAVEGYHDGLIKQARTVYNALPEDAKQTVDTTKLEAVETKYAEYFIVLNDMTSTTGYSQKTDWADSDKFTLNFSVATDSAYGNYLNVELVSATGEGHVLINYPKATVPETAQKIYTYIYYQSANGSSTGLYGLSGVTLVSGEWTKVELTSKYSVGYIGKDYLAKAVAPGVIKIGTIYATTEAYENVRDIVEAQAVEDMITALPQVSELTALSGTAINKARNSYDSLSENAKTLVTNYEDLTALETAYAESFYMINDMTATTGFSQSELWGVSALQFKPLSIGTDATVGNYLSFGTANAGGDWHLRLHLTKASDLSTKLANYSKVSFYVYNGRTDSVARTFYYGTGTDYTTYGNLVAGEWTEVTLTKEQFLASDWIGVMAVGWQVTEYRISAIYAHN